MASNLAVVATGGIGEVTDMGRWREKKDEIFTSALIVSNGHEINIWSLECAYRASEDSR